MGLAASQARFLAITARKMNCEFESMQIAQEKLSVTRDMEQASQDYQAALDASKLIWETPDGDVYDLTYAIMMTPSNFNDYNAYLVTDVEGKIVLTKPIFDAALKAGMIDENGNPIGEYSESGRNAFLEALCERGQLSSTIKDSIEALGKNGYSKSGVGGEILDKTIANVMQTTSFINFLKTAQNDDKSLVYQAFGNKSMEEFAAEVFKNADGSDLSTKYSSATHPSKVGNNEFMISNGKGSTNPLTSYDLSNLTIGDILTGNYALTYNMEGIENSEKEFKNIVKNLMTQFAKILGYEGGTATGKGLCLDAEANEALAVALELTIDQFAKSTENIKNCCEKSEDYNTTMHSSEKSTDLYSINLSNMMKSFLTNFAMSMDGFQTGYNVNNEEAKSVYVTDNLSYYFAIKNNESVSNVDQLNADFYNQMYNVICMYGACTDKNKQELVTDPNYLNNALKNGQLFIASLNTDGYFYTGHYTLNGHVGEIPDEDAIARAELKYEQTKSQLNYKEESLELKMKNLDMEISSLTTEYDTVKNLISKNVEKVFTMFGT